MTWALDSVQGFLVATLGGVIVFGVIFAVVLGVFLASSYGPLAFVGVFGSLIGALAFVLDRKVGRSLQFGDYSMWKRMMAQGLAFVMVLGVLFLLVFAAQHRLF